MKFTVDNIARTLTLEDHGHSQSYELYSKEAFEILSNQWVNVGWSQRYAYTFSWMGRPVIQLPEDMIRMQEVIYRVKPDVIIETGVAHGGSLIYYASLCKAMAKGRVVGIDIEIKPHNRHAIENHELSSLITLIEGSSIAPDVVAQIHTMTQTDETVLVILDSNHTKGHVLDELNAYADLITPGSYIVATDGIMREFGQVPRGQNDWEWNNPAAAAATFAQAHPEFQLEQPAWPFNESELTTNITYWPDAWLRRK